MNSTIIFNYINKLSIQIASLINAPWLVPYIPFLLLGLLLLVLLIFFKILKAVFSPLLRPIQRRRDAAREKALAKADKKAVMKSIKKYVSDKDYSTAAELYVSIDEFEDAAKLYEQAKELKSAAEIYERIGNLEKAAALFKEIGNRTKAAELFIQIGKDKEAAQMYEAAGFSKSAAELYEKADDSLKAAELYERCFAEEGGQRRDAGSKAGYAYQSGKLYEKAGRLDKAINIYLKDSLFNEAAVLFEKKGDFIKAGENYLKANSLEKSSQCFKLGGDLKKSSEVSSRIQRQKGSIKEAAALAEQAGDFHGAAEMYIEEKDFAKAGDLYLKAGDFNEAGEQFVKAGSFQKAADAFEKGKNYLWAAKAYERIGDAASKVPELYERAGDYLEAGRGYKKLGLLDRAVNTLQKIDAASDNYGDASILIGEIFLDKGMTKLALERFQKLIGSSPINKSNLEPYYFLAICYEKFGDTEKAKAVYDKILAEDYHFKDVSRRSKELTKSPRPTAIPPQEGHDRTYTDIKATPNETGQGKRYYLLEEVGRGGMGIVYKAKDTLLNRIVAYKLLPSVLTANPIYLEKFLKEARLSANLNHTNIVTIFDTGRDGDNYYIIMEYIEGKTLREYLKQINKFKISDAVKIAKQICRALAYAHSNKIVHRDIKPANIMISRERMIKIMDFGVAKLLEDITKESTSISGTPLYMSPEQIIGKGVDNQSDLYSLGITLFELITGRTPFVEGDLSYHHLHSLPPPPKDIEPAISDVVSNIILKCLEKDKARRYKKAEEILIDLDKVSL
ncbi:MAG: protein kinase [Nitrospirae bacterium]|nr:protein kinase [Nitrospirota bacterium]